MSTALTVSVNGQNSVSDDQFNTYAQTCDNVSQLRAFVGITGIQVYVRGLDNILDGGQGFFYWSAGSSGPDDGVDVIIPNGAASGAWIRIFSNADPVIPCTATGVNALTLTGSPNTPPLTAYNNFQQFAFTAPANSTGPLTAEFVSGVTGDALGFLPVYLPNGSQAGSGAFTLGSLYVVMYSSDLNTGHGGLQIVSSATGTGSGTVTEVDTGAGLTGGPINTSGTVSLEPIANNTVLQNSAGSPAVPVASATPVLGTNGGTGGQVTLNGATSGSVVLRVPAAAGTGTIFNLPDGNGSANQILVTDGSGNTSWQTPASVGGGLVLLQTINASNAPSVIFNSSVVSNKYNKYLIEFDDVVFASVAQNLRAQIYTDGGTTPITSNYKNIIGNTGQSGYYDVWSGNQSGATTVTNMAMGGRIYFIPNSQPVAFESYFGGCNGQGVGPANTYIGGFNMGAYAVTGTPINAIKLSSSSGNIGGNFHLYGLSQ